MNVPPAKLGLTHHPVRDKQILKIYRLQEDRMLTFEKPARYPKIFFRLCGIAELSDLIGWHRASVDGMFVPGKGVGMTLTTDIKEKD